MPDEDWNEYRRLVLAELKRLTERIDTLTDRIARMESGMAVLQFRSGLIGALLGALGGAIPAIIWAINKQ